MEKPKEILFEYLDKHRVNYETHYIDDTGLAFDAIEEAMFEFARKYHDQKVKSVDLADGGNCTHEDKRRYRKQGYMAAFTGREGFRKLADEQFDRLYDEMFYGK